MKSIIDSVFRLLVLAHGSEPAVPPTETAGIPLLLIEHRDEVFARLAADLENVGCAVERAVTADEAALCCRHQRVALVLCYRDLPDESGWLIASKLRLIDPSSRIWLYAASFAPFDQVGAEYSGIEDLVYDHGDLSSLSRQLRARLWGREKKLGRRPDSASQDPIAQVDAHIQLVRSLQSLKSVA